MRTAAGTRGGTSAFHKKGMRIFGLIYIFLGVMALAVSLYVFISPGVPEEFIGIAEATIMEIEQYQIIVDTEMETRQRIHVEYRVDGETYKASYDSYEDSLRKGGRATIQYDMRNPQETLVPGGKTLLGMGIGLVGLVFLIPGIIVWMRSRGVASIEH